MHNLFDLFRVIDEFREYLDARGFAFSLEGLPIFEREMFLKEIPDLLVPVSQRKNKHIKDIKKTAIVFYVEDERIYPRLNNLLGELDYYKNFMGVVEPDTTVTEDMDLEWQKAIIYLNQLAMAVLAVNGIKIVCNTRAGTSETLEMFRYIPSNVMVASGFRGGVPQRVRHIGYIYLSKVLILRPSYVLIYGSCVKSVLEQLDLMGISHKEYKAFRDYCKEVA